MKRDMDFVRELLLAIEQREDESSLHTCLFGNRDPRFVGYHFELVDSAGFLIRSTPARPVAIRSQTGTFLNGPVRLSWKGCEYLDKVRDDGVWQEVKEKLSEFASAGMTIISAIAVDVIKRRIGLK